MYEKEFVFSEQFNIQLVLKDIVKNFWVVLLAILMVFIGSFVYESAVYTPEYTTSATFVISAKSSGGTMNVYASLSTAREMAGVFRELFSSNVLKRVVREKLDGETADFQISANVIAETNLLKVSVTSPSPKVSYEVMQLVISNYGDVSDYLLDYVVLDVLQNSEIPHAPSNALNIKKYQLFGMGLAAILMTGIVVYFCVMRKTVKTRAGANRYLGEWPVGVIPHERKITTLIERFLRRKRAILITNPIVGLRYVEAYHKIAYKLQHKLEEQGKKVLLVTGVGINEGKSTAAANLALAFAKRGKKVVLLDLDLRRAAVHKIFEVKDELFALGDCLKQPELLSNLHEGEVTLITNKKDVSNPGEYIQSTNMDALFQTLRQYADIVILDSAPLAIAADSELLTQYAEAFVLIARQDDTPCVVLQKAITELEENGSTFFGYIINDYREENLLGRSSGYYGKENQ